MKLVIEIQVDLQVVLAGTQSSSQHRCSTILIWSILVSFFGFGTILVWSDQCRSFMNQVLCDPILLVSTEIMSANCSDGTIASS